MSFLRQVYTAQDGLEFSFVAERGLACGASHLCVSSSLFLSCEPFPHVLLWYVSTSGLLCFLQFSDLVSGSEATALSLFS